LFLSKFKWHLLHVTVLYFENACCLVIPYNFPNFSNDGTITYQAQSQDEEALVTAASKLNMVLVSKDSNTAGWYIFVRLR
jgi:magnesium-transporting ATPase (P-type)